MKLYLQISENKLGIMEMQNTFPLAKTQSKVCDSHYCHFVGVVSPSEERVQVALEELHDLKGVWVELSKIWEQIDELKEKTWLSVAPRKVNKTPVHLCPSLSIFDHLCPLAFFFPPILYHRIYLGSIHPLPETKMSECFIQKARTFAKVISQYKTSVAGIIAIKTSTRLCFPVNLKTTVTTARHLWGGQTILGLK